MEALPTKSQIRKMFPGYTVSIEQREMTVYVAPLTTQKTPALVITRIVSKTESFTTPRKGTRPVELDTLGEGFHILKDAGFNAFCSNFGAAVIPSDVTLFNIYRK